MKDQPQKLKYEFKRNVCTSLALFLFVVIGAGCVSFPPPPKQESYIETQSVQNSEGVSQSK